MESSNKQSKVLRRLRCSVQIYDWGRHGHHSQVAKLFSFNSGSTIEPNKPYAELWMGTHESGPSYVIDSYSGGTESSTTLKSWISQNPKVLGDKVFENWDGNLPFLFKVLSVAKALSIQAHPDKEWAQFLHKSQPNYYKDENHKPEMALAITHFEALCGFISLEELKSVLHNVPEIVELIDSANVDQIFDMDDEEENAKQVLRSIFTQIMLASKEGISTAVNKLKNRLHMESQVRQLTDKERLALLLDKQYSGDVGVISSFFLNYVKLKPGEALYLGANEPHAYLLGECIECMATSDNVVRAGLTSKHKDIKTLCSMLSYKQGYPEILQGVEINQYTRRYLPPFDEFEVDCCILPVGAYLVFPAVAGPSIFVVMSGDGKINTEDLVISEGDVWFVPANAEISVTTTDSELSLYRAGVNSRFFL